MLDKDHIQYGRVLSRLGRLYLLQGRFQAAEETSLEGIKQAEQLEERIWIVGWKFYLAYVEYVSGYYDQALEVLSADWDYELKTLGATASFKDNSIHLKGLVYLKKGLLDQAQNAADELAELENTTLYNHLLGSIEVNRGNYSEALPYFEKALAQSPNDILFLFSAASANHASGDLDKAQERYERIVALTDGRTDLGGPDYNDLFAKSYYRLGQICEQRGWKGKAIENYEEFLTLWKDADPGLPEVDDAKKRLGLEQ